MNLYHDEFEILKREHKQWVTEEEVRLGWLQSLNGKLKIRFHAERGRSDAEYNQFIIEFKKKGFFRNTTKSSEFLEALEELSRYIQEKARAEDRAAQEYVGIAIDGDTVAFAHIAYGGEIAHGPLMPLSPESVAMVFEACRCSSRRSLTEENLIEDFGHGSISGNGLMQALADGLWQELESEGQNKTKMLFQECKAIYGQVADLSITQVNFIIQKIGFYYPVDAQDRLLKILFVIHTFYSIFIKLITAEIVSQICEIQTYSRFSQNAVSKNND